MQFIAADFVQTTLSAAATSTDTSLSITSATGIPALVDGQALPITLINAATQTVYEICYITAISGTTITVLRGQEGTVAQSWSIGDLVKSCRTSGTTGSVVGTLVPAGSFTLPAGNSPTLILTDSITADSTFTLPAAPLAGTGFTVFGSAAAYTTTVSTGVTSGSPYIEMPDGSQVYSYVIPASSPGAGIRIVWDGTNYRGFAFGQTIVAPATAANQAPQLGQWTYGGDATAGWRKDPAGNIEQWGQFAPISVAAGTGVTEAVTFPIAFTDAATVHIQVGLSSPGANGDIYAQWDTGVAITTTGFTAGIANNGAAAADVGFTWTARGR
jgi:hypothetical protein